MPPFCLHHMNMVIREEFLYVSIKGHLFSKWFAVRSSNYDEEWEIRKMNTCFFLENFFLKKTSCSCSQIQSDCHCRLIQIRMHFTESLKYSYSTKSTLWKIAQIYSSRRQQKTALGINAFCLCWQWNQMNNLVIPLTAAVSKKGPSKAQRTEWQVAARSNRVSSYTYLRIFFISSKEVIGN